jgi:hypothetical protein
MKTGKATSMYIKWKK